MGFLGSIGNFLKNPIQPITHAIGKTAGVTASLNGVHIDPVRLLTTAEALGGNPLAMAGVAGNAVSTLAPNSGLGKVGDLVGEAGALGGSMTGGLGALKNIPGLGLISKIPGASALGSAVGKIPGASAAGSYLSSKMGGSGASADGSIPDTMPGISYDPDTNTATPDSSSWLDQLLSGARKVGGRALSAIEGNGSSGGSGGSGGGSGGINPLILEGLTAANIASAAAASKKQGELQDQALNTATGSYNSRAPLRTAGVAGMMAPPVKLNLPTTGNPFALPATQAA